ncbi:endolytic transglycosylase MltG [Streptomyces sp. XM4193]|uniref:endolytic transglycosylase MltG n=1 Tax=Streptomyces sp. XM4193 TaxID=2929782 RepID=UPI001FFA34F8|nr:endolytic transglycosylase MltG [Streptomyces sp. XM4193]MCK1797830.1 endolytic transglycosylase MltG [Streptomyces sp. XM4193]
MTEYGRGPGSQPWHPEDPLYGDQGWDGTQQAHRAPDRGHPQQGGPQQDPYGYADWQQQPAAPQSPYGDDPLGMNQQQGQYQDPSQQYQQQQQHQSQYDPHAQQGGYGYGDTSGGRQSYAPQDAYGAGSAYGQDPYAQQHDSYGGGIAAGQQQGGYPAGDPYAQQQGYGGAESYGGPAGHPQNPSYGHGDPHGRDAAYGADTSYGQDSSYGADTAYGQDASLGRGAPYAGAAGAQARGAAQARQPEPAAPEEWDSDSRLENHAFFSDEAAPAASGGRGQARAERAAGRGERADSGEGGEGSGRRGRAGAAEDDDFDDDPDEREPGRRRGRGRKDGGRKDGGRKKNGMACLTAAVVLVGGVGGAGYLAYDFLQGQFGSAPDYSGEGSGEVQVEIPTASSLSDMGNILKKAGVVKSHDAFVEASGENGDAAKIHAGTYLLRKGMSAEAAIKLMLDPASQSGLIVPEGLRASKIYELIDERTESPEGTTEKVAESTEFDLPSWAEEGGDPLEGFLFPSKYSVSKKTEPVAVLKEMVKRANAEFKKVDLEGNAKKVGRTPYEVLTIASLIQAEAQSDDEFGKVSRVVYNRIKPGNSATNGRLDFDSTINYALGRSTLDVSVTDTKLDHPYNTYRIAGLPPGPIDNPGHQAIESALKPTKGEWLYFVTVRAGDTRFSETFEEHSRHVREFNEEQRRND